MASEKHLIGRSRRSHWARGRLATGRQHAGLRLVSSDQGLAPRALRDITAAGRFDIDGIERALWCTTGSLIATMGLLPAGGRTTPRLWPTGSPATCCGCSGSPNGMRDASPPGPLPEAPADPLLARRQSAEAG